VQGNKGQEASRRSAAKPDRGRILAALARRGAAPHPSGGSLQADSRPQADRRPQPAGPAGAERRVQISVLHGPRLEGAQLGATAPGAARPRRRRRPPLSRAVTGAGHRWRGARRHSRGTHRVPCVSASRRCVAARSRAVMTGPSRCSISSVAWRASSGRPAAVHWLSGSQPRRAASRSACSRSQTIRTSMIGWPRRKLSIR